MPNFSGTSKTSWQAKHRKRTPTGLLYATPTDALKAVREDYLYWTQRVTEYSFSLPIALIGANWAVFGGLANKGISNFWSKLSLASVILSLVLVLVGTWGLGYWHGKRIDYAEEDPGRWEKEYATTLEDRMDPWPYTKPMNVVMGALKLARTILPVAGSVFFFIGLLA